MNKKRPEFNPEVVGIGESIVDLIGSLSKMPKEDTKVMFKSLEMHVGGPASLSLISLARLGIRTSYIGNVADDYFGRFILKIFRKEGVLTDRVIKDAKGSTPLHIVISTSSGRTIFKERGNLSSLVLTRRHCETIKQAKILFLDRHCGRAGLDAAVIAKQNNIPIVLDPSVGLGRDVKNLFSFADIIIAPQEFISQRYNKKVIVSGLMRLWKSKKQMTVITLGKHGCIGKGPDGIVELPSVAPRLVDSNGAGDVFRGAFIYGLIKKWNFYDICKFANHQAGLKCAHIGL